jgi:restriction system protein
MRAKRRPKKQSQKQQHMSWCDAAEAVLRKEGKALSYTELAKKAVNSGLLQTRAKTTRNIGISMHVSLRSEMERRQERKEPQRFMFLGNGMFTLVELVTGIRPERVKTALEQVRESRAEACSQLYQKLTAMNQGTNFETMVADLLMALGYDNVEVIGGRDDQGVDIVCEKRQGILVTRVAIQCKCKSLASEIGPKDVSTLRDNLSTYQCQQGIIVTTSNLNRAGKDKARESGKEPINFIEHDNVLDLFAEHGIGIRAETVNYYQMDASQYDFLK